MKGGRLLIFAYSDVGHACLRALLDRGENVVEVYTHEDRPGEHRWFPSVAELARSRGLSVRTEENLKQAAEIEHIRSLAPDLIFSFYYRNLIPLPVLRAARLGAFNMHGSLLPRYRGRAPVNWAVLHGETRTGATLHAMVEKADAGDIVDQKAVDIGPDETAISVQEKVTRAAVDVLLRSIDALKAGSARLTPQNAAEASYFGRRTPEDGRIDWTRPARRIHDLVRAVTHPYPGAFADVLGRRAFIWSTRLTGERTDEEPGTIHVTEGRLSAACGDGELIEILRLEPAGEREMAGAEFARRLSSGLKEAV